MEIVCANFAFATFLYFCNKCFPLKFYGVVESYIITLRLLILAIPTKICVWYKNLDFVGNQIFIMSTTASIAPMLEKNLRISANIF